jgi:hypothetical protein
MRFPLAREWNVGNILNSGGLKCLQTANTTSRRWYNNAHYSIPFGNLFPSVASRHWLRQNL